MPIGRCCSASRASKIKVATHHRKMSSTITWNKIRPLKLSRVAGCGGLELSLFPRSRLCRRVRTSEQSGSDRDSPEREGGN